MTAASLFTAHNTNLSNSHWIFPTAAGSHNRLAFNRGWLCYHWFRLKQHLLVPFHCKHTAVFLCLLFFWQGNCWRNVCCNTGTKSTGRKTVKVQMKSCLVTLGVVKKRVLQPNHEANNMHYWTIETRKKHLQNNKSCKWLHPFHMRSLPTYFLQGAAQSQ